MSAISALILSCLVINQMAVSSAEVISGQNHSNRVQRGVAANTAATASSKTHHLSFTPITAGGARQYPAINQGEFSVAYEVPQSSERAFTPEEKLVSQLLNRGSLMVRPNGQSNFSKSPVYINITYNVVQILAFSQAEETMSISGWFTMKWCDPRLTWDPQDYSDITEVNLPSTNLWIPDVGVMNAKSSADFDFSTAVRGRLTVFHDGVITWLHGAVLDTTCPLNVAFFPFDFQTCFLILTPWQSGEQQLLLRPFTHGSTVDNSYLPNSNVSEWEIQSVHFASRKYRSDLNITYQYVSIGIHLKRQPLYFVVLVLVPFSMLSALACLIFTLDDTGDRLSVALSLVLSMTMYVVIVSSNAPRSMRTLPVLGIFLLDQLGLLSIATILAVINNKLYQAPQLNSWQDWIYVLAGISRDREPGDVSQWLRCDPYPSASTVFGQRFPESHTELRDTLCNPSYREHNCSFKGCPLKTVNLNAVPKDTKVKDDTRRNCSRRRLVLDYLTASDSELDLSHSDSPSVTSSGPRTYAPVVGRDVFQPGTNGCVLKPYSTKQQISRRTNQPNVVYPHHDLSNHVGGRGFWEADCDSCVAKSRHGNSFTQSPWVVPLTTDASQTGYTTCRTTSPDEPDEVDRFSSAELIHVTAAITAAATMAVAKMLNSPCGSPISLTETQPNVARRRRTGRWTHPACKQNQSNPSWTNEEKLIRHEDLTRITLTAQLAASAVTTAFKSARPTHRSQKEPVAAYRYPNCGRNESNRIHCCGPRFRNCTDETHLYPYRRLASKLDCIQMASYLILSTINAFVCLVIMPVCTQETLPPKQWIM
ncbi:unnamed protein product [Dicrocoelium dendriticum]|nr:unnamed protein product [Dicrocoelium dendriticum]